MKPAPFAYHRPETVDEALALLAAHGPAAKPLAGGQSLIPAMNFRLARPAVLVDLNRIAALASVREDTDDVRIGAMTRQRTVERDPLVRGRAPLLTEALPHVAHAQIRNRGTVGGSVAHADPAGEIPAVLLALEARFDLRGPGGIRTVPAERFFTGLFETALDDGELVTAVKFAIPEKAGYEKFRNPASRYAMAAAFVSKHRDGHVRVAITGAGNEGVFRWTEAEERLTKSLTADALDGLAIDPSRMMGDIHAPADYRAHLVTVMARRAVQNLGGTHIV